MKNKYVDFISDEHFLDCVANLHKAYLKAKNNITKKNFYTNKVDTIKLTFDAKFNDIDEESLIQAEILRQIDKSINNLPYRISNGSSATRSITACGGSCLLCLCC